MLQLRVHPSIIELKERFTKDPPKERVQVSLAYVTRRGSWYQYAWKGDETKSGGVAMNIGIHFFDMLMWLFGSVERSALHLDKPSKKSGTIDLEHAHVKWFLSVDGNDLPEGLLEKGQTAYRSITIDGEEIEFSGGFTDLHTRTYEDILAGGGYGIDAARPAIEFVHSLRAQEVTHPGKDGHEFLNR